MPPKKVPIKGEPDFTNISDDVLKGFLDLTQQLIFSYKNCDEEKTRVLRDIRKQMSDEYTDRISASAIASIERREEQVVEKPVTHKIKMVKRIKR